MTQLPGDPFDKLYGRGAANTNLLELAAGDGVTILYHPALSVQSGEGSLSPLALASIAWEAQKLHGPTEY